jgi:hypothetical protein
VITVDKAVNLITIISSLTKLIEGSVMSKEEYDVLKGIIASEGYSLEKLKNISLIKFLQEVCKDFSTLDVKGSVTID